MSDLGKEKKKECQELIAVGISMLAAGTLPGSRAPRQARRRCQIRTEIHAPSTGLARYTRRRFSFPPTTRWQLDRQQVLAGQGFARIYVCKGSQIRRKHR